jgi:GAF domain-containing protein
MNPLASSRSETVTISIEITSSETEFSNVATPLSTLNKAIAAMGRAESFEDVVETLRATARSLIGCDGIAVIRREGDLCHYIEEDAIGPLWRGHTFPASGCISGWAMIHRQTVLVPDVVKDDRIPHELYAGTFVKSVAMAPVRVEDPIGAIGAYWARPYSPAEWEVDVLETLAGAAAIAIEKTQAVKTVANAEAACRGWCGKRRRLF